MSNDWFEFNIPYFNLEYGSDWDSFETEMETNTDNIMNKTFQLYRLDDPNMWTEQVTEIKLDLYKIPFNADDTFKTKKSKFYNGISRFKDKGLASIYIDAVADITGVDGVLYSGNTISSWIWGESFWGDAATAYNSGEMTWGGSTANFQIYFDVKTIIATELDEIQLLLEEKSMRPAFYTIYLIDSSFVIYRIIGSSFELAASSPSSSASNSPSSSASNSPSDSPSSSPSNSPSNSPSAS